MTKPELVNKIAEKSNITHTILNLNRNIESSVYR